MQQQQQQQQQGASAQAQLVASIDTLLDGESMDLRDKVAYAVTKLHPDTCTSILIMPEARRWAVLLHHARELAAAAGAAGGEAGAAGAAGAAAGRGSDDASAKAPGGSPKLATTSVTTVALSDKAVTLHKRFPHIKLIQEAVTPVLEPEALEVVTRTLLRPALSMLSRSQLSTEAARVHVVGLMLLQAVILFTEPQHDQPLIVSSCDSLADGLSISEQATNPPLQQLGFEQHIRAGSFKGRVELQVVRTTEQGAKLFAGALEIKQEGCLTEHVEQAKKEAFAMWCHNALLNSFGPVWVVLTNLSKVLRVTYEGDNYPGGPASHYRQSMPCSDVKGSVRCTDDIPFISFEGRQPVANLSWEKALQCFVGGLLGRNPPSAEELTRRLQQHVTKIEQQLNDMIEAGQRARKRSRSEG